MNFNFRFAEFPVLTTKRLILRELQLSDAADVFAFRSDPEVQKYNSEPHKTLDQAKLAIEEHRRAYAEHKGIDWAMAEREGGRVIGLCGFSPWSEWHGWVDLGYDLRRDCWGQGLASEGIGKIVSFAFDRMLAHRVEAGTLVDNVRSVRLLERLGFKREGTRRERVVEDDGSYHDGALYSLLKGEYVGSGS